jgi:hypothetical protein
MLGPLRRDLMPENLRQSQRSGAMSVSVAARVVDAGERESC